MIHLSQDERQQLVSLVTKVITQISDQPDTKTTDRERTILFLLSKGKIYKQIAAELYLSPRTVESQAIAMKNKMGCSTITQMVAEAIRKQIIQ